MIDDDSSGTCGGLQFVTSIAGKPKVDISGTSAQLPCSSLRTLHTDISAAGFRPEAAVDAAHFNITRASVNTQISAALAVQANISAARFSRDGAGDIAGIH